MNDKWPLLKPMGYRRLHAEGREAERFLLVDVFENHRALFFSLATCNTLPPPNLISIDYHQDLNMMSEFARSQIVDLNVSSTHEVTRFVSEYLSPLNHDHITAAIYMGLVENVVLLSKSGDCTFRQFADKEGRNHEIRATKDQAEFEQLVLSISGDICLDIDLDFFVERYRNRNREERFRLAKNMRDSSLLDPNSPLMRHCAGQLRLITIAREAKCCDGLLRSNQIFEHVWKNLFVNPNGDFTRTGLRLRALA